ncbi:hypothetical protein C0Q70_04073 [Pomacea canaliculata]|uniref:Uncharacterized protein n=1 Tax=Pomacea canaliculata TaxID=400727 RepID=A0A2T7PUL0_POMCA|nr:hypothetical protein C0Q70_04073 [Pomacea canaliculata]
MCNLGNDTTKNHVQQEIKNANVSSLLQHTSPLSGGHKYPAPAQCQYREQERAALCQHVAAADNTTEMNF